MNKQEKIIAAVLFLALLGWMVQQNRVASRRVMAPQAPETNAVTRAVSPAADPELRGPGAEEGAAAAASAVASAAKPDAVAAEPAEPESDLPESTVELRNDRCRLVLTSKGGGIRASALLDYPAALDAEPGSVVEMDFAASPALALEGIPGLGRGADFTLAPGGDGRSAELRAQRSDGLTLVRRLAFTNGYRLAVSERFENTGDAPVQVPAHRMSLGTLRATADDRDDGALAAEFRMDGGRKPEYLEVGAARLAALFGGSAGGGCSRARVPEGAPVSAETTIPGRIGWAAARTRFFVQILTPSQPARGARVRAERATEKAGAFRLAGVETALELEASALEPGASLERQFDYYVGPRKLSLLRALGAGQSRIMRFGMWRVFCEGLLDLLNFLHRIVPNYGVAIILLTGLVRLVMYPVTKRGAESMKRMQALQPKLKELQALYKDDPQKQQRETMRLYSENKVNPLSSCLPMLIQLPVFIALFTVLRSAVELRFAPFLWVADLSAPENLFRETFGFGINLLPVAMAGTMALQSYLTPSTGDPAQQRMMMVLMPGMMLVMFYSFPAALGLYWTTSQLLAIGGLLWQRRKAAAAAVPEGMEIISPPKETRQMRRSRER